MTFRRKDESWHLVSLTSDKADTQKCLGNESACGFLNLQYQAFNRDNGMDQNVTTSLDIWFTASKDPRQLLFSLSTSPPSFPPTVPHPNVNFTSCEVIFIWIYDLLRVKKEKSVDSAASRSRQIYDSSHSGAPEMGKNAGTNEMRKKMWPQSHTPVLVSVAVRIQECHQNWTKLFSILFHVPFC